MDRRGFLKRLVGAAVALPFVPKLLEVEPVAEPEMESGLWLDTDSGELTVFEREVPCRWVRATHGRPADDRGLDLDDASGFVGGDLALVPRTGEIVRVDYVLFDREIVVRRGYAGTAACEVLEGDLIKRFRDPRRGSGC